ncbi:sugar transferase [Spiribacter sp. 221]|uniref:sugar transferase n=1 Tax=Spiribacter onubensis TaxID=3122420 RepID=UPI00349FC2ED
MQRALDIVLSSLALVALSPLLIGLMGVLRLTGEGEVFYRQTRIGRGGVPFGAMKFATMLKASPSMGTGDLVTPDDPRVLPLGRLLRATKLNELPQLINILKGEMSLIGPRPQTPSCFDAYPADAQKTITQVRPGLSGIGSIVFRHEEAIYQSTDDPRRVYRSLIMPYKGALECWYVERQNLRLYLALIALTVWVVISPRSRAVWTLFPSLPRPPEALAQRLSAMPRGARVDAH